MTTEELLAESVQAARERETTAYDLLARPVGGRLVLFGAGSLGRKVLAALRAAGIAPLAFADNDMSLQGGTIDGLSVLAPADAIRRWGRDALFVATIFRPCGGEGMGERLESLAADGCAHTASFLPIAWRFPGVLPHYGATLPSELLRYAGMLRMLAGSWGDTASREIFRRQLAWRLWAEFPVNQPPSPEQYFPSDLIKSRPDERFVDGGAFDGDTLAQVPGGYARAWAFEPDPGSAALLRTRVDGRVVVSEAALGSAPGRSRFRAMGTPASARAPAGEREVQVSRLDDVLSGESPTFIKLDVEGDELAALRGAHATIRRSRPILAVCVYHRPSDLWEIPCFLLDTLPGHRLFLRIHDYDGFELVAYSIPPGRCTRADRAP
jgi:FkbM family methyltransferase